MAVATQSFTTGPSVLPDVGELSYEGCIFSPLCQTQVSGVAVKDAANRTTKVMEYTITVDGYVTMDNGDADIDARTANMRELLSRQGGALKYTGRGCNIIVNQAGADINNRDVAWGPIPKVLEFVPLGAGRSAKVKWTVTVQISELTTNKSGKATAPGAKGNGLADIPMLQFVYDTALRYTEDGFSTLTVTGVLEIPLTRTPNQTTRTLQATADDLRNQVDRQLMANIDLERFRITSRDFKLSKDKRMLEWSFVLEEKPYMDLPPDCPVARGTYSVRPAKVGMGLVRWLCTLRATYVVRADRPRRMAWMAFLMLVRERMAESENAPDIAINGNQNPNRGGGVLSTVANVAVNSSFLGVLNVLRSQNKKIEQTKKVFIIDFSFEEGLYLDSKTVSFSITWTLVSPFTHILLASGLWKKVPERSADGKNLWAVSMKDVSGANSWLVNRVDPSQDVIVDFGT